VLSTDTGRRPDRCGREALMGLGFCLGVIMGGVAGCVILACWALGADERARRMDRGMDWRR
jgi:hypothetical protein